jgi:hypothetical protein
MRSWLGSWRTIGSAGIGVMLGACSGADVSPATAPSDAADAAQLAQVFSDIGERCPGIPTAVSAPAALDEIFLEAVVVDVPSELAEHVSLRDLPELATSRRVRLVAAPHVMGGFGSVTSMALGQNADAMTPLALARWSMLPRRTADQTSILELEIELSTPEAPNTTLRFSVTARDNEPSLAHVVRDAAAQRSLLVAFRAFRVHGESELRAIFECKMQQRARYLQRAARAQ